MMAFGTSPWSPTEFSTTTIIGASARIGMVCEAMAQGMTLRSMVRECTIPTASAMPSADPMAKPSSVGPSVTPAW